MKSYPVVFALGLVACGSNNEALFDDFEAPLPQVEPATDSSTGAMDDADGEVGDEVGDEGTSSQPPGDEAGSTSDAMSDEGDPGPAIDEGTPDALPIDDTGDGAEAFGGGDPDPGQTPVTEPDEPVGPRIVSVSPPDGAIGVSNDQPIVVTFSTAMDQEATERAYQSEGIPSGSVSFDWSDDGTVLTITPNQPLEYDTGTDPEQVEARSFTFFISASAEDLEGNSLGTAAEFGFSIFRQITGTFFAVQDRDLTGSFRSNDTYGDGQCARAEVNLCVGDSGTADDEQYKGFITFDLSPLPPAMARLDSAELVLEITDTSGNPFRSLGDLVIEHAAFDVIGSDAFQAEPLQSLGVLATNASAGTLLRWDVREAVEADFAQRSMTQYRLYFEDDTDGDGNFDAIISSWETQALELAYLLP